MKLETRRAALRAAQAVAGLTIAACSPAPPPEAVTIPASDVPNKPLAPASSNGACVATVEKFFPGVEDPYEPNKRISAPREVERCCHAAFVNELSEDDSKNIYTHWRWRCCTVVDRATNEQHIGYACTPWGPPVPPPMRKPRALVS